LPAASSSSLNPKALFPILLFCLSFVHCTADTVWEIPIEELRARVGRGESAALAGVQVTRDNRDEAFRLGRQAPYYLALHFLALGRPGAAEQLWRLQWEKGASPWREEALLELLAQLVAQERYGEAESEARGALRRLRDPRRRFVAERLLIEALYWQQRDGEVLERLGELRPDAAAVELWDDELELFAAVASCRLGRPGWQGLFVRLFVESRTGTLHGRAFTFLELRDQLQDFSPGEQALLKGKMRLAAEPIEALSLLEEALPALAGADGGRQYSPGGELAWSSLLFETASAGFASGEHARAAQLLQDVAPLLGGDDALYARELAARVLLRAGQTGRAAEILRQVVASSSSASQRDRASWFLLAAVRRSGLEPFVAELRRLAPGWHDPAYFRDLIDQEVSPLVAAGRWRDLQGLLEALGAAGPAPCRSRLAYLLGRAAGLGLPGAPGRAEAPGLLSRAWTADPGGYHALLAAALLGPAAGAGPGPGAGPVLPPHDEPDEAAPPTPGEAEHGQGNGPPEEAVEIVRGHLSYGLVEGAYELLTRRHGGRFDGARTLTLPAAPAPGVIPAGLFREAAERLSEGGEYLLSIRLMNRYLARSPGPAEVRDLELLYPRGYAPLTDAMAERYSIAPELFYALVREESHFDPRIVSRSGAVGLTQLMADTAADSARRLRLEEYDLRDPGTNLRMGAEHYSRLDARLESVPKALMAYNAGLSRVRGWERRYSSLPQDLMVEAVPFAETRGYVRKILVSAVQYGRLYYGLDLRATVLRFYPELGEERQR